MYKHCLKQIPAMPQNMMDTWAVRSWPLGQAMYTGSMGFFLYGLLSQTVTALQKCRRIGCAGGLARQGGRQHALLHGRGMSGPCQAGMGTPLAEMTLP